MGTQQQALLQVSSLSVDYASDEVSGRALSNVSFSVEPGESVGVLGESGSGKSTLARAIVGSLPASARIDGSIRFCGREILHAGEKELQRLRGADIALVGQDPAQCLNPVLTIGAQVQEVLRAHHRVPRRERRERALEALRAAGFADPNAMSRRYPHQLSGGERQRAVVAQAIVCRPALLIADEPTSKLDPRLKRELLQLFDHLRSEQGMALLLISHEPAVIASVAERVTVMYAGEIVELGPAALLFRDAMHPYTKALVNLAREQSGLRGDPAVRFASIPGEMATQCDSRRCWFEPRCAERMAVCAERHPTTTHRSDRDILCLKYE